MAPYGDRLQPQHGAASFHHNRLEMGLHQTSAIDALVLCFRFLQHRIEHLHLEMTPWRPIDSKPRRRGNVYYQLRPAAYSHAVIGIQLS